MDSAGNLQRPRRPGRCRGRQSKQGVLGNVLCLEGPRGRGVAGQVCGGLGRKEEAPRPSGFRILRSGGL